MDSSKSAPAAGLQTVVDVILAPVAAFERLRTVPTWGWAFVIAIVGYAIGAYVMAPAFVHGVQQSWPAMVAQNPRMAQMTPEQQQQGLDITLSIMRFAWIGSLLFVPIGVLIWTVVMLIFNAIGRGTATFASLWAAAANIAVPTLAISSLVTALIVVLRGPESFNSAQAVAAAAPSLAWLAPAAGPKMLAFLGALNVFQIWGGILVYLAMRVTARAAVVPSALCGIVLPLAGALMATAGAH